MIVTVDSREKDRKDRAIDFYTNKGHEAQVEMLDVGDYLFDNSVVFEYKEISDFMSSIKNNSVFNEAANQSLEYKYHYVIIVGDVRDYLNNNWSYYPTRKQWKNRYDKFLAANLLMYYGAIRRLRVFTCPVEIIGEENAFQEMLLQAIKCLDGKSKFYSNVTRQVESQDPVDVLLSSCRGVSSKKANAIRKHHSLNSVWDLMELTVNDFKAVDGFGEKSSNNVYNFLHKGDENAN